MKFLARQLANSSPLAHATARLYVVALIGLVVVVGLAYSNHFHNAFQFDDAHTIVNNNYIRELRNIPRFFRDGATFSSLPPNQSYRPLVSTLLAISYALGGGLDPLWFHILIFSSFVTLVLLLAFVLHQLLQRFAPHPANRWIAVAAAGWYGLHPANADTVNYVIACSDVISTLGIIASFACYFAFPRFRRYYIYVLPAAFTVLAKPPAAVFPVLFAVYRLFDRDADGGHFAEKRFRFLPYVAEIVPSFIACGATLLLVQYLTPMHWVAGARDAFRYVITQPYTALLYFQTFLWPSALSADYDLGPFTNANDPRFLTGLLFTVLLLAAAIAACRSDRTRSIGFGLLWFLIALLPTALLPLAEVMNDHRTFFPYIGLIVAAAGAASFSIQRYRNFSQLYKLGGGVLVALLLCGSGYATYRRNQVWRTNETLWADVVAKSPGNSRGLMNYGTALMARADYAGALDYFHRAQLLAPNYSFLAVNIAIAEDAIGHPAEAERNFQQALRWAPTSPVSYTYYARWLWKRQHTAEAFRMVSKALELAPGENMARDLFETSRADFERRPTPERYLAESLNYYQEEKFADSIMTAQAALSLKPDYAEAWNNIGAAYNALGRYEEAASACEHALSLMPDLKIAENNLRFARARLITAPAGQ